MATQADPRVTDLLTEVGFTGNVDVEIEGEDPVLPSPFPVGEAAAVALGATAGAAAELWEEATGRSQRVRVGVEAGAASLVSFILQQIDGPPLPFDDSVLHPVTTFYEAGDGRWIHLHGGFPHLAAGTLAILGCSPDAQRDDIASAVRRRKAEELEEELAAASMCGAMVRTGDEWAAHPQAAAIAPMGRVAVTKVAEGEPQPASDGHRPLGGIRALDLTRLLAGPSAGRALAEHGADVLLVNSPTLPNIALFNVDTGHGKRSTYLDVDEPGAAQRLRDLTADADVFVQSYRAAALARRGFGPEELTSDHRGLVYVTVNCYGDVGPWRERPGWEQMAESVTGLAAAQRADGRPALVPAACCDYITGYLAALGTMAALRRRAQEGGSYLVQASLCQTGTWLSQLGPVCDAKTSSGLADWQAMTVTTDTPFGLLRHLPPAATMSDTPPRWDRPPVPLGTDAPVWLPIARQ